jgi:pimeloyl-ACP methyl ester carboxylesterase
MRIRRAVAADTETLLDLWLRAARATYDFVAADDIAAMTPEVRAYLASGASELWVACDTDGLRSKVLVPGTGHWLQQERPAEVSALLVDFLRGLG